MEGSSSLPVTAVSQAETRTRLLFSAVFTLTLSILGRYLTYMPKPANVLPWIDASASRIRWYHLCNMTQYPDSYMPDSSGSGCIHCLTVLALCSSVLPVPFAFSRMGVLLGIVTMAVVAYSNSLTSVLLLRAAGLTGHDSYEGVAYAIGGKGWKVYTFSEQQGSSDWPLTIV